ncbi:MAG TPA: HTTM domain-containing protein [Phycisphaerales bacterium]|nr:HTTM domain-containing protein [Phycisphaerales bacterium]
MWRRLLMPRVDPALTLGVFRIALCIAWLVEVSPRLVRHFALYPPQLCFPPGIWSRFVSHLPVNITWLPAIYTVFVIAALTAAAGIWTRRSLALMLLAGGWLLTIPQFFGHLVHYNHLIWFALIMLVAPCDDRVSVRALLAARQGHREPAGPAHTLALWSIFALLGVLYFFPGFWKMIQTGSYWLTPSNLITIMHHKWSGEPAGTFFLRVDHIRWLCGVGAVMTVAFELFFWLLIFRQRTRVAILAIGIAFHLAIWLVLVIDFISLMVCLAGLLVGVIASEFTRPPSTTPTKLPTRRIWPITLVAGTLLLANIFEGISRRNDWPLACYPTFGKRSQPTRDFLIMHVRLPSGEILHRDEIALSAYSTTSRARSLCDRADAMDHDMPQQLRALYTLWTRLEPQLATATEVWFTRQHKLVDPDAPDPILSETELLRFSPLP